MNVPELAPWRPPYAPVGHVSTHHTRVYSAPASIARTGMSIVAGIDVEKTQVPTVALDDCQNVHVNDAIHGAYKEHPSLTDTRARSS